jgi:phage tail sheath gpL-like
VIVVAGFSPTTKTPIFAATTTYGVGPINLLSIPLVVLCVGLKATAAGTITPDVDVVNINSKEDADTYLGAGGECALMCYDVIDEGEGFQLKAFCPAPVGGAVAATVTITIVGTSTGTGQRTYTLDGKSYVLYVTATQTPTQQATALAAVFNADARCSMIATPAAGVVTLADKCATVRGNQNVIYQDMSLDTSGTTSSTLAGSAAVTGSTYVTGVFAGATLGSGVETLTNTLAVLLPGRYNRVAIAQNDATSLGLWLTQTNTKAGPTQGRTEHFVFGANGTSAAAISLAQTTVNNQRFQCVYMKNSLSRPCRMAAAMASVRATAEGINPNSSFDDHEFVTIPSQMFQADWIDFTTGEVCLNAGVTPLRSTTGHKAQVIRSITTRCLSGTIPDYRTLDTALGIVPDFCRDDLKLLWTTQFKLDHPYVAPDPAAGEDERDSAVATPTRWNTFVKSEARNLEKQNILTQTALPQNQPLTEYNTILGGLMTSWPIVVLPANHSQGLDVRQGQVVA